MFSSASDPTHSCLPRGVCVCVHRPGTRAAPLSRHSILSTTRFRFTGCWGTASLIHHVQPNSVCGWDAPTRRMSPPCGIRNRGWPPVNKISFFSNEAGAHGRISVKTSAAFPSSEGRDVRLLKGMHVCTCTCECIWVFKFVCMSVCLLNHFFSV